jgi:ELWxxDGT repeat protein
MNFTNPVNITEASDDYITFSAIAGNKLLFNDNELFSIDASDNVSLAKDINPGESPSYPRYGSALENQVIFLADDGTHGFEMWKTDGTEAGTSLVKDVASNTAGSQAGDIYRYNDKLYFQATSSISDGFYKQLWESDGTEAGTRKINETIHDDLIFAPVKNYIVTIDDDRKFVKTNLSTGVTSTLTNLPSNSFGGGKPLHSIAVNNDVYFYFSSALTQGGPDTGLELWRANPFTNELDQPKDIKPGFQGTYVSDGIKGIALNGKLIFSVDENADYKTEPWVTDGTETGTFKLKDIADGTSANPVYFKTVGNRAIFIANDENYLVSLWSTDGTSAGTVLLKEGANYEPAAVLNGKGIFGISNPTGAPEIWTTDGTVSGTSLLAIVGTENDYIYNFVSTESKVYFVMNSQDLWETDGTVNGTRKTNVSIQNLNIATHTTSGETLIFLSEGKLWATLGDLSATETIAETDVQSEMFVIGGYVYFLKDDETYGRELFKVEIPELVITGTDQEESAENFKIFPNPTAKTLFVKAESPAVLRIIDMNGREKHNQFITGDVGIDVSNYADGLYVVTLNGRQQKFIKLR